MEAHKVQWRDESYETIMLILNEICQLKSLSETKEDGCLDLDENVRSQLIDLKKKVGIRFQETQRQLDTSQNKCCELEQVLLKKDQMLAALKNHLESHLQNMETKDKIYLDLVEKIVEIEKIHVNDLNIQKESQSPKTETSDKISLDLEQGLLKTNMLMKKAKDHSHLQVIVDYNNKLMNSLLNLDTKLETSVSKVLDLEQELLVKDKMLSDLQSLLQTKEIKFLTLEQELLEKDEMLVDVKNSMETTEIKFLDLEQQILDKEEMRLQLLNDLRKQEELYLQKIEEKDEICSDLRDKVLQKDQLLAAQKLQLEDYQQQCFGMNQRRLQLLADLKQQEDSHLQELETRNNIISQLQQELDTKKINFDLNVSCSICLEATNTNEHRLVSLQCGHLFGDKCVRDCINKYLECPLCRNRASLSEIRYMYCN